MKKFVLIDGNSLINRAFYATPSFSTSDGTPTNAIFGFTRLIFKIIEDVSPDYMLVAFDMHAPTFRHKMYKEYKGTRKEMPQELAIQFEPIKNLLSAMKIASCGKAGIEADDILGTLSKKFDVHSFIYTGDRDSFQLVDEKTDVYFTKRGVTDLQKLSCDNFLSEVGIKPCQVVDLKAMMGDKSDNIPGVPGVGEKTAHTLLAKYGSLSNLYEHLSELPEKLRVKFENNREIAELSYNLAKIDTNCELDIKLEDCAAPRKYGNEVKQIFKELEFNSFLNLDIFDDSPTDSHDKIVYPEKVINFSYDEIIKVITKNNRISVAFDENTVDVYTGGKEYVLNIAADLFAEANLEYGKTLNVLKEIFSNKDKKVILFDAKQTMYKLNELNIDFLCSFEDLSIAKYLCEFKDTDIDLKSLCNFYLYDYSYPAFAQNELFNLFYSRLSKEGTLSLYEDLEKPLVEILYEMESIGVKVSVDVLDELSVRYKKLIEEYQNKVYQACGIKFNLNSPVQLGKALYEKIGITEVKKKNSNKYTTNADVLEKLVQKYPVVDDVLKFRSNQKLYSTYIEGFRPLINRNDSTVHTTFNQTATATGRLSSSNPNLQNIPIREEEGRELRKVFIPRDGNVFIDADYSQIELRLLAHFSGCKELIEAYNNGTDIHSVTASQVFGVPLEGVTPQMRRNAKAVNFGIIYGISEFGLARDLNVSFSTAKEYIEKYFNSYSAVREYMDSNVAFARANGYVSTLTGRKRVINEINSPNRNIRMFGERAARNMPLQGSSADIIKIAMINVCKSLKENNLKTRLILQVHDELVLEAPENEVEEASSILKYEMENAVKLNVPLTVEVHTGKNWYDAK